RNADTRLFRQIGVLGPLSRARLGALSLDGAAQLAGLAPEDVVLQVDGTAIVDAEQLREVIRTSGATGTAVQQRWLVERGASRLVLAVTPKVEKTGDGFVGRIGAFVGAPPMFITVRYGPLEGLARALNRTGEVSMLTLRMMGQIAMGEASLKNLSGPITIADYAGKSAAMGLTQFLVFLALISISLGVLNLLPVPVLDGGHLMYYLWESLTGQPVSQLWMDRLQRAGLVILLMMMSIAVFNDVTRVLG
ncbi:MAG: RIP metalloprotease RseP, partial [Rhodoferax sp.]